MNLFVSTLSDEKLPVFVAGMLSARVSTPAPIPPAGRSVCDATGTCLSAYSRPLSPQVTKPCVIGLYELDGQSMFSKGRTTQFVVSYGSKSQPNVTGWPSGPVSGSPQKACVAQSLPWPFFIAGKKSVLGVCGI